MIRLTYPPLFGCGFFLWELRLLRNRRLQMLHILPTTRTSSSSNAVGKEED